MGRKTTIWIPRATNKESCIKKNREICKKGKHKKEDKIYSCAK